MAGIRKIDNGSWQARFYDDNHKQHARNFARKVDAQAWIDDNTTAMRTGTYVDPSSARMTVSQWAAEWLKGYEVNRASTVRQARTHLAQIEAEFGAVRLSAVKPSDVRQWIVKLQRAGLSDSYVYALHGRLAQVYSDAIHDGVTARNPCSRRTSPKMAAQRPYVLIDAQVWALHDAMDERVQVAVLLGAFAGLRSSEVCGLRTTDIDFMRGVVTPAVQAGGAPLKSPASHADVPIPFSLVTKFSTHSATYGAPGGEFIVNKWGDPLSPRTLEREFRRAADKCRADGIDLPERVRFHDLRHYFASLLIGSGANVKEVQARLRHASAKVTLDTYAHLFPDADDSTRATVDRVIEARAGASSPAQAG